MSQFSKDNLKSGVRKLDAEKVMAIYQMCQQGMTQGAIARATLISVGQIGRILRGESWSELYHRYTNGLPLHPQDVSMHFAESSLAQRGAPPVAPAPESEVAASLERLQALMAKEDEPQESIIDILERRTRDAQPVRRVPTLEEVEARERAVMGVEEGSGLDKLLNTQVEGEQAKSVAQVNADKLLETLK